VLAVIMLRELAARSAARAPQRLVGSAA